MGAAVKIYYSTLKFTRDIFFLFPYVYLPFLSLSYPQNATFRVALDYCKTISIKLQDINKMYCFKNKIRKDRLRFE